MPRTRTIRRSPIRTKSKSRSRSKKATPAIPFLPESFQVFIARRFVDVMAMILILSGLFLTLALTSYNPQDPSFNTASSALKSYDIQNWMGAKGAAMADIIIQTLGAAGLIISITLSVWGLRVFNRQTIRPFSLRIITLIVSSILASIAFAQIPSGSWTPQAYLGGSLGSLLLENIGSFTQSLTPFLGYKTISILCGFLALPALVYTTCMTRDELANSGQAIVKTMQIIFAFSYNLFMAFRDWIGHYNDDSYISEKRPLIPEAFKDMFRRNTDDEDESEYEDEDEEEYDSLRARTLSDDLKEYEDGKRRTLPPLSARRSAAHIPVVKPETRKAPTLKQPDNQQRFLLADGEAWEFPSLNLLEAAPADTQTSQLNETALRKNAELLQNVLADFNIEGEITSIHPGPVVTLYELEPAPGTKSAKVISLADDIARSMSAVSVRVAVVPGRNVIGIELPNKTRQIVYMQELLASRLFEKTSAKLPLILGKDIGGQPILADLAKMPHLLVAGTTGSGKSVAVNTMILSLLYGLSPERCRFIMIDPKMLELSVYDDIPHLLSPVVTEPGKAVVALKWTVNEMENRYRAMSKLGVRNIEGYNARIREALEKEETIVNKVQNGFDPDTGQPTYEDRELDLVELPYIVVVVDEFADLMLVAGKDVESAIQRLAQMARAAGIHLIMATQRPSVDVITGVIKANFPTRISFQVTSKIDSRTILGEGGAEQLLGMGDMLYMAPGGRITRVHGPFVSDGDVEKVVDDLKAKASPAYIDSVTDGDSLEGSDVMNAMFGESGAEKVDELYDQAVALVAREGKASTSFIQRYLQIGYNRAARIIEEMERQGIISPASATGKRDVLIHDFSDV